jgi:hypothetical protein
MLRLSTETGSGFSFDLRAMLVSGSVEIRRKPFLIPTRSRNLVGINPEEIPKIAELIPTCFGIKSGSRRLSPLDFGIKINVFHFII